MRFLLPSFKVIDSEKVFLRMGKGIERRNRRYPQYWSKHQLHCRQFQQQALLQSSPSQKAVIIGAGFLFDFDSDLFAEHFRQLVFVDGNPKCQKYWQKFASQHPQIELQQEVAEVTTVLGEWRSQLVQILASKPSWQEAMLELSNFAKKDLPRSSFFSLLKDADVVSLNILSQLPLAWQEIVESCLKKNYGSRFVEDRQEDWVAQFLSSAKSLVVQHLRDLVESEAASILLIADREYCYYAADGGQPLSRPVVDYCEARWQRDDSAIASDVRLSLEITPALYGIELRNWITQEQSSFSVDSSSSWVWHIAPPGEDGSGQGIAHLVEAYSLKPA